MSFHTMASRVQALGGNQNERIDKNMLKSLQWALKNSGAARQIETERGAMWAMITRDTASGLHSDYEKRYIGVPFDAGLSCGDTFRILDEDTHWMVYLPVRTQTAYFRAQILQCRYSYNINGQTYWIYFQGPTETDISWNLKRNMEYNEPNLSGTIYIKKDENTTNYFHRFDTMQIEGRTWQVQVPDEITVEGIIELEVQEYYNNTPQQLPKIYKDDSVESPIHGFTTVKQDTLNGYSVVPTSYSPDKEWKVYGNPRVRLDRVFDNGRSCNVRVFPGAIKTYTVAYGDDSVDVTIDWKKPVIQGPQTVYPFETHDYWLKNIDDNTEISFKLSCNDKIAKFVSMDHDKCSIEITSPFMGAFVLYAKNDDNVYKLPIKIKSL